MGIDDIARSAGKQISEIGADITILSLKKQITSNDGKYYLINGTHNVI